MDANVIFFGLGAIAGLGALVNTLHLNRRIDRLERELREARPTVHGGPRDSARPERVAG